MVGFMRRKKTIALAVIEKILCDNPCRFSDCSGGCFSSLGGPAGERPNRLIENKGASLRDHTLCQGKKGIRKISHRNVLCLLTCLLMGDSRKITHSTFRM